MAQLRIRCGLCNAVISRLYLRNEFQSNDHDVVEPKLRCCKCKQMDALDATAKTKVQHASLKRLKKEASERRAEAMNKNL